jgi:hypothetical protein
MEPLDAEKEANADKCLEEILGLVKDGIDCTAIIGILVIRHYLEYSEVSDLVKSA